MKAIRDLHKHDKFKFNGIIYVVTKKYQSDDSPLKAYNTREHTEALFHNENLEVEIVNN
jgi:hypothetical protein